jgi:uncharacterized protein YjbJ (UPF0337 family)
MAQREINSWLIGGSTPEILDSRNCKPPHRRDQFHRKSGFRRGGVSSFEQTDVGQWAHSGGKNRRSEEMDKDRIEGIGHQVKGAVKEGLGRIIGDAKLQADGTAERASGKVQNAIGSARDEAIDALANQDAAGDPRKQKDATHDA